MNTRTRLAALTAAMALSGLAATGVATANDDPPPWAQLCGGLVPTIFAQPGVVTTGTNLPDVILGTPFPDEIHAAQGNDVVCALGGDDRVFGGPGDDLIYAQDGNDHVDSGIGHDTVFGGYGNDDVRAGDGEDTVLGGPGDDRMWGEDGPDTLDGGPHVNGDSADGGPQADSCPNSEFVTSC